MPPFGNSQLYMNNLQNIIDSANQQMRQMQQYQPQQPTAINQTFQLAPNQNLNELDGKYANDIEEVRKTLTLKDTLFIDKSINNLWLKRADGSIRIFTLSEVFELDEKDKTIIELRKEINELKEMMLNAKSDVRNDDENVTGKKPTRLSANKSNDAE